MISICKVKNNYCGTDEFCIGDFKCVAQLSAHFLDDKTILKTSNYLVVVDGVILNRIQLQKKCSTDKWGECLIQLYEENGEQFFTLLRGSYIGAIYDIKCDKWIIFRNPLGGHPLYYSTENIYVSTDITWLYDIMKENNVCLHLDPIGVRMVLETDLGMTIDNYTICKEVKKLHPCCYLVYENGELTEKQSYTIKREEVKLSSEDDYLEMIDETYKNAVKRQFGKDDEYGYKHVACLSGGIDSRMTVWIAHYLGWDKQLNITSSSSGWYDETVARQIAKDLNHEWLFKPMDDANFMYQVDESTRVTGGCRAFYGVMHMECLYSLIDYEGANLGILHTGSQGEIFKGEAVVNGSLNKKRNFYLDYLKSLDVTTTLDYSDPEICTIMNKYLQVDQGDSMSPLLDLDFFEMSMRIPAYLRKDEYIYKQWVTKKHPDANKYVWANSGLPYGSNRFNPRLPVIGVPLYLFPKYLKYKMGSGTFGMNPFNRFYDRNKGLKEYYDSYACYINTIEGNDLRSKILEYFNSSNIIKRMKAISILSAIKLHFS